ncbi:MAG: hypothetical protein ABFS21_13130, partial [Actinomycetota bacterium]
AVIPAAEVDGGEGEVPDTTTTSSSTTTTIASTEEDFIKGLAGTVGISRPASEWIVPIDTFPNSTTSLWMLNAGANAVTVELVPLGEVEYHGADQTLTIDAGAILGVEVDVGIGIYGYHIKADGPVSVAWEMSGDRGAVLVTGVPTQ